MSSPARRRRPRREDEETVRRPKAETVVEQEEEEEPQEPQEEQTGADGGKGKPVEEGDDDDDDPERLVTGKVIGESNALPYRVLGAISILSLWSCWILGFTWPFWWGYMCYWTWTSRNAVVLGLTLTVGVVLVYPFLPGVKLRPWPAFVRFALTAAYWYEDGAGIFMDRKVQQHDVSKPLMVCMHLHGLLPLAFFLNGAARAHTGEGYRQNYMPDDMQFEPNATGVAEPLLFKTPLVCYWLAWFGCAEPASRKHFKSILERAVPFGVLVGGSEEIILCKSGAERVYIRERKGFIKYALQYGYNICIAYSFGESDNYYTINWFEKWRMRIWKKYRVPIFFCVGKWWCPLLSRNDHGLHTVYGKYMKLPRIEQPTQEDIDKWHATYMESLVAHFNKHKAQFGYADRELELC